MFTDNIKFGVNLSPPDRPIFIGLDEETKILMKEYIENLKKPNPKKYEIKLDPSTQETLITIAAIGLVTTGIVVGGSIVNTLLKMKKL